MVGGGLLVERWVGFHSGTTRFCGRFDITWVHPCHLRLGSSRQPCLGLLLDLGSICLP